MGALPQTFSFGLKIVFIATNSTVQERDTHQGLHAVKIPSSTELGWISPCTNKFFQIANLIWCHSSLLCLGICNKCRQQWCKVIKKFLLVWTRTQLTDQLTDWLAGWQTNHWLTDWLTNQLTDWLTDWPTDFNLTDSITTWLIIWLTDWPINWLAGWLND